MSIFHSQLWNVGNAVSKFNIPSRGSRCSVFENIYRKRATTWKYMILSSVIDAPCWYYLYVEWATEFMHWTHCCLIRPYKLGHHCIQCKTEHSSIRFTPQCESMLQQLFVKWTLGENAATMVSFSRGIGIILLPVRASILTGFEGTSILYRIPGQGPSKAILISQRDNETRQSWCVINSIRYQWKWPVSFECCNKMIASFSCENTRKLFTIMRFSMRRPINQAPEAIAQDDKTDTSRHQSLT